MTTVTGIAPRGRDFVQLRAIRRSPGEGPADWWTLVVHDPAGAGHVPRYVIGSVNLTEFVVTVATSATFIVTLGLGDLAPVIPLVFGGLISAPFAGYLVKIVSTRLLMVMVGSLILLLSARTLLKMAGLL